MPVDGCGPGAVISLPSSGGRLEVHARVRAAQPAIGAVEIVVDGVVVAAVEPPASTMTCASRHPSRCGLECGYAIDRGMTRIWTLLAVWTAAIRPPPGQLMLTVGAAVKTGLDKLRNGVQRAASIRPPRSAETR
jgi:hypothetical protein